MGTNLEPNHTNFILVDNCQLNKYGGEIQFRTQLEDHISDHYGLEGNKIPIIVLVLGGGPNTFKTCLESVKQGAPCVFIEVKKFKPNFFTANYS